MYQILAFSVFPLSVLLTSIVYALIVTRRLRDWRPLLFVAVLVMMSIHQTNEIIVFMQEDVEAALAGVGEYPETAANILASLGTVLFLRWVEHEQRLAQQFEERVQERTAELESFTYSVSHDLRTPLRTIDGFSKLLEREYGDRLDEDGQRYIDVISESAGRMSQLIDDLLALSRLGRKDMQRQPIDMDAVVREVVAELNRSHPDHTPEITLEPLPPATGDPSMVQQVFANLLSNAFKFTSQEDAPQITVGADMSNGTPVYYVEDNGAGFDMDNSGKLFGVFERLHTNGEFEGTGVGLAVVERIIRRHDGRIWADAAVEGGATFYFTLDPS